MTRFYACLPLLFALGCEKKTAAATPAPASAVAALAVAAPSDGRVARSPLAIVVDGQPAAAWSPAEVAALPRLSMTNKNGETRDGWSLRDAAKKIAAGARVTALVGEDGERLAISPGDWSDAHKTLVLKVSNRGSYKAHWLAADGSSGDAVLKNVAKVEFAK